MNTPNSNDSRPSTSGKETISIILHARDRLSVEGRCNYCKKLFPAEKLTQYMTDGAPFLWAFVCDSCAALEAPAQEIVAELREKVEAKRTEHTDAVMQISVMNTSDAAKTENSDWHIRWISACDWFLAILSQSAAKGTEKE